MVLTNIGLKNKSIMKKFDMRGYWENRYINGGNSGEGSRGYHAKWKAHIVNSIIKEYNIKSIFEYGCGDFYQLEMFEGFDTYTGYDISPTILELCKNKSNNESHIFVDYIPKDKTYDLTMSIDVLQHLVNKNDYEYYINELFSLSHKFVLLYSHNGNVGQTATHIYHRIFTEWIQDNKNAELVSITEEPSGKINDKIFALYKIN
jgi:hypothetical protein